MSSNYTRRSNENSEYPRFESDIDRVAYRLREAQLDPDRFVDVQDGEKRSTNHTNLSPDRIDGNYGVYAGDRLVLLDVDDYKDEAEMEPLASLPETFTVESPHSGEHRYYTVPVAAHECLKEEFGVPNPQPSWGEVRAHNQYVVGPGSQLDDCERCETCQWPGEGYYRINNDVEIAEIEIDTLTDVLHADPEISQRLQTDSGESEAIEAKPTELPDVEEGAIEDAREALREFHNDEATTQRARDYLTDLLNGKYEKRDFDDRSEPETTLATLLYGIFRQSEYTDRAEELTVAYITEACDSTPFTGNGEIRKWVQRGDDYRANVLSTAVRNFTPETFKKWQRKKEPRNRNRWTGEYATRTREVVREAVDDLVGDDGYPTKDEVISLAQERDDRKPSSHYSALKRLQQDGELKRAQLDPWTHVWYPDFMPDPPDAIEISHNGETYTP